MSGCHAVLATLYNHMLRKRNIDCVEMWKISSHTRYVRIQMRTPTGSKARVFLRYMDTIYGIKLYNTILWAVGTCFRKFYIIMVSWLKIFKARRIWIILKFPSEHTKEMKHSEIRMMILLYIRWPSSCA